MNQYLSQLTTEKRNTATMNIDLCSTREILSLINAEDEQVARAVGKELDHIARAADIAHEALSQGGRLIYVGAGTSGRLGVLDASECPPTFGTDPNMVIGVIAGGDRALRQAVEGCEDDADAGISAMRELGINGKDAVAGITASGSAAFVLAAVEEAGRSGAKTIGITTNAATKLAARCTVCIAPLVGPEVITGSTRLKSGTAQKLVLNMITTCAMIKLGKVYGNLMVDLRPSNAKLNDRSRRIISEITGISEAEAEEALGRAGGSCKLAIMMTESGLSREQAEKRLNDCGGVLRRALGWESISADRQTQQTGA